MALPEFVAFDTETTGLYKNDRVIEVAAVVFTTSGIVEEWSTLINPARDVGKTDLHGITPTMLSMAPSFDAVANDIARIFNNRILVGHNFPFDRRMINQEFVRQKSSNLISHGFCTMTAARRVLGPESVKLTSACEKLGIPIVDAHSALGDAKMTQRLFLEIYEGETVNPNLLVFRENELPTPTINRAGYSGRYINSSAEIKEFLARTPFPSSDEKEVSYFYALNMAFEDLCFDEFEKVEIDEWAYHFGISPALQRSLNTSYFEAIASASSRDGFTSFEEIDILAKFAEGLGVAFDRSAFSNESRIATELLKVGIRICFTGQALDSNGAEILRKTLEALAAKNGFHPVSDVTKHGCDLLVASDVYSMSDKAIKAKRYGKEVMSVSDFLESVQ